MVQSLLSSFTQPSSTPKQHLPDASPAADEELVDGGAATNCTTSSSATNSIAQEDISERRKDESERATPVSMMGSYVVVDVMEPALSADDSSEEVAPGASTTRDEDSDSQNSRKLPKAQSSRQSASNSNSQTLDSDSGQKQPSSLHHETHCHISSHDANGSKKRHPTNHSDEDLVVLPAITPAPSIAPLESSNWSFAEMRRQRQAFFAQQVEEELERQQRPSKRPKVPTVCSAVPPSQRDGEDDGCDDTAAEALQRVLKKEDFHQMEVLGQFNLGFIIGKLDSDLFIIDQHASDEKFNYETLQRTTVMHQQPLVRPLPLELTAGEEMVVIDHLDVFAKNGFTFQVDANAPATRKLKLLSLPFTKHTQFGPDGTSAVNY